MIVEVRVVNQPVVLPIMSTCNPGPACPTILPCLYREGFIWGKTQNTETYTNDATLRSGKGELFSENALGDGPAFCIFFFRIHG